LAGRRGKKKRGREGRRERRKEEREGGKKGTSQGMLCEYTNEVGRIFICYVHSLSIHNTLTIQRKLVLLL
jgi:hypothetical protein